MRFDSPTLARLRKDIMKRGQTLSIMLADVLAGKEPQGLSAILKAKPGMRPHEAIKKMLDEVEARRKLIDANDDAYGRCDICGEDLGLPALEQMPWADRCQKHANI